MSLTTRRSAIPDAVRSTRRKGVASRPARERVPALELQETSLLGVQLQLVGRESLAEFGPEPLGLPFVLEAHEESSSGGESHPLPSQNRRVQGVVLGYTFQPRRAKNRYGEFFVSFLPAMSAKAAKAVRKTIREWCMASTRNNREARGLRAWPIRRSGAG
jgi:hypothetical protein